MWDWLLNCGAQEGAERERKGEDQRELWLSGEHEQERGWEKKVQSERHMGRSYRGVHRDKSYCVWVLGEELEARGGARIAVTRHEDRDA